MEAGWLTPDDSDLFEKHQCLVDHLFAKTTDGLCNLYLYRCWAKDVSEHLLEKADPLSHKESYWPGLTADWPSREEMTMFAIRRNVHEMIKDHKELASTKEEDICRAYAHVVLEHENDVNCDVILRRFRSWVDKISRISPQSRLPNIPADGTCS